MNQSSQPTFQRGFSKDFKAFLDQNYKLWGFHRPDIISGCYGGAETRPTQKPSRIPIIFIHGNSDVAVGDGSYGVFMTGFSSQIEYFLSQGYEKQDLYATTWGDADSATASLNYHSENYLKYNRAFVEAVLEYTKSPYVNIISHSMGVTLARKIIKGGTGHDELGSGRYDLGDPLTSNVKVFVGLAGGNQGLTSCYTSGSSLPTCGMTNGFYPGQPPYVGRSEFLEQLDSNSAKEGKYIVTGRANYDEIIGGNNLVWGKYTTRIKNENEEILFNSPSVGHFGLRDEAGPQIYSILKKQGAINQ
ncbi:unnamed protein product [Paramecium pentaurelia]|uniref:Lipase n=1 Tax=Paramecium pentaurelia TaxID=43138 RepID=A0A8S1T569_9CILI|nr:unnamed protein product [Paramecium pentaurelia]